MGTTLSKRSIRTFVLRQGRLTEGQQRSLDCHWATYGLEAGDGLLDLPSSFGRDAPVWMEIGFGNGEALVQMAAANPAVNFLGVEVHLPGVGHALGEIARLELSNVRIIRYDALELLANSLPAAGIDRLLLFFPDPWHKTRHHKRRMVNPEFLERLTTVLTPGGFLHMATDWPSYATHMRRVLETHSGFERIEQGQQFDAVVEQRPRTRFEQRGLRLGHPVADLVYRFAGAQEAD